MSSTSRKKSPMTPPKTKEPQKQTSLEDQYRLIRESCARIDFSPITKLRLTGEDRKGWLQGQITNDLRDLQDGGFIKFCILTPTGQIVADCDLWSAGEEYIVTFAEVQREATKSRLEKMLILEDVKIEDLSSDYGLISVQGPKSSEVLDEILVLPRLSAGLDENCYLLRSDRTGSGGWDIVFPKADKSRVTKLLDKIEPAGAEAVEIARIESGIPLFGKDMNERTLAMEMGIRFIETRISFTKGCYTGQEIVERIRSRGHANKRWLGIIAASPVAEGDAIGQSGALTSAAISPEFGPIAAVMLRADSANPGQMVTITSASGAVEGELVEMPLRL